MVPLVLTTSRSPGSRRSGEVPEAGVDDAVVRLVGDEQPDLVAGEAPGLGRLAGLEAGRELEIQIVVRVVWYGL